MTGEAFSGAWILVEEFRESRLQRTRSEFEQWSPGDLDVFTAVVLVEVLEPETGTRHLQSVRLASVAWIEAGFIGGSEASRWLRGRQGALMLPPRMVVVPAWDPSKVRAALKVQYERTVMPPAVPGFQRAVSWREALDAVGTGRDWADDIGLIPGVLLPQLESMSLEGTLLKVGSEHLAHDSNDEFSARMQFTVGIPGMHPSGELFRGGICSPGWLAWAAEHPDLVEEDAVYAHDGVAFSRFLVVAKERNEDVIRRELADWIRGLRPRNWQALIEEVDQFAEYADSVDPPETWSQPSLPAG